MKQIDRNKDQYSLIHKLPPEITLEIFTFLNADDLALTKTLCRYFRELISSSHLQTRIE